MFKIITQKEQLTKQQQTQLLNELDDKASTNPAQFYQELKNFQQEQKVINFLKKYAFKAINILFKSFSFEESFAYMNNKVSQKQFSSLRVLQKIIKTITHQQCIDIVKLYENNVSTIEKRLLLLKLISQNFIKECPLNILIIILPHFIKLQAFILQDYFKIKNQPSKNAEDYVQTDLVIVQKSQQWAAQTLTTVFRNLPNIQNTQQSQKKRTAMMILLIDVLTALLQGVRQKNLKASYLQDLITELNNYILKNFTVQQIRKKFLSELQMNGYQNPIDKIIIQQNYTSEMKVHTVGVSYLCLLQSRLQIYDKCYKLKLLMPAISEMLSRSYEFKTQLINQALKALEGQTFHLYCTTQWDYPTQLFLFNALIHEPNFLKSLKNHLIFTSRRILLNSLIDLKKIKVQNHQAQKDKYILDQIIKNKLWQQKRCLVLLKQIQFDGTNQKYHNEILECMKNYYEIHQDNSNTKEFFMQRIVSNATKNQKIAQQLKNIMTCK